MKRLLTACALVLCVPSVGCSPPIALFEDVGSDPHPPTVKLVGMAQQPEEVEGETPEPDLQPADGFVVRASLEGARSLLFRVEFTDVGGDVVFFVVRDRDSDLEQEVTPSVPEDVLGGTVNPDDIDAPEFFSGTSGTADLENVGFETKLMGAHRMELWAEDSHGSRSEKVSFTVEIDF